MSARDIEAKRRVILKALCHYRMTASEAAFPEPIEEYCDKATAALDALLAELAEWLYELDEWARAGRAALAPVSQEEEAPEEAPAQNAGAGGEQT